FFGKFMARWHKDRRSSGLFIALPGVNSQVKGFYNENCRDENEFTVRIQEEDQVWEALGGCGKLAPKEAFGKVVPSSIGVAGECALLGTEFGYVVVQHIIPNGSIVPSQITLLDASARPLTDRSYIEKILAL